MDKTQTINVAYDCVILTLLFSTCQVYIPMTMRSCNSITPEERLVCIKRRNELGDYKGALQVSLKVSVELAWIKSGICHSV